MSYEQNRTYHRTFLSTHHQAGLKVQGCNPPEKGARPERKLETPPKLEPVRSGPQVMPSSKLTEEKRYEMAQIMHVPYIAWNKPTELEIADFLRAKERFNFETPKAPPTPKLEESPGRRWDAYYSDGQTLTPIVIEQKKDQVFAKHATPWERQKSKLATNGEADAFLPIVDQFGAVIGHYGHINADNLRVRQADYDKAMAKRRAASNYAQSMTIEDMLYTAEVQVMVPVFCVSNGRLAPTCSYDKPGWVKFISAGYENYAVQVDIDGVVIEAQSIGNNNGHAVSVNYSPVDLIQGGRLVLQIALKPATKAFFKTIARREVVRKLTNQVANKVLMKLPILRGWQEAMGIPRAHFDDMVKAARDTEVIAIFRANKQVARDLIEKGSPGKPMFFKFKTSKDTGVLTAETAEDIAKVRQHGYLLVDADGVARRTVMKEGKEVVEELHLQHAWWKVEKGQVIDPVIKKPVVGDYDLLGVAPLKSPGSSVAGVPDDVAGGNWTGPWVEKYQEAANLRFIGKGGNPPRVLHGAQDQYQGIAKYQGLTDDTAYAVFPDGRVVMLEGRQQQQAFYDAIGRKPGGQGYPKPSDDAIVIDEVAIMRAKKAKAIKDAEKRF